MKKLFQQFLIHEATILLKDGFSGEKSIEEITFQSLKEIDLFDATFSALAQKYGGNKAATAFVTSTFDITAEKGAIFVGNGKTQKELFADMLTIGFQEYLSAKYFPDLETTHMKWSTVYKKFGTERILNEVKAFLLTLEIDGTNISKENDSMELLNGPFISEPDNTNFSLPYQARPENADN